MIHYEPVIQDDHIHSLEYGDVTQWITPHSHEIRTGLHKELNGFVDQDGGVFNRIDTGP